MNTEFLEIKVKDIMQKEDLPLVERETPIEDVLPFPMGRSHVWVIDNEENRRVVGVITEHDILDILSPSKVPYTFGLPDMRQLDKGTAEDVMTRNVVKCDLDDTVGEVLDKMTKHEIRRIPATDEEGIISGEVHLKHITNKFAEMMKRGGE